MRGSSHQTFQSLRSSTAVLAAMLAMLGVLPGVVAESLPAVVAGVVLALWIGVFYQRTQGKQVGRIAGLLAGDPEQEAALRADYAALADSVDELVSSVDDVRHLQEEREEIRQRAERLLRQMSVVATGNLAAGSDIREGELAPLATSFNQLLAEMRSLIARVLETSDELDSASGSLGAISTTLTTDSSRQATLISESCERLEEVQSSIEQLTRQAARSLEIAQTSYGNAQLGVEAIDETTKALQRIQQEVDDAARVIARLGDSSREIGAIVQFIAQIARQTNTLALNASIQAARAGEHGRGFAVVAEEVRTLAERSSNATRQISALVTAIQTDTHEAAEAIESSTRDVGASVRIVGEAAHSVSQIGGVLVELREEVSGIENASRAQLDAVVGVSRTMREVADTSKTVADRSLEAAESSQLLATFNGRLRQAVSRYVTTPAAGIAVAADGDD